MTFIPPTFAKLRVNTLNLEPKYSTLLGRYTITDSQASSGSSLEVLIARTNDVIRCKSGRGTQIDVFNKLVNYLRDIPKENKEKIKEGALYLLGALIHRYFRLIKEYENPDGYISWSLFGCDITTVKLFLAIRTALQFKAMEGVKKRYKSEDLKILDAVTAVKALEAFRNNMFEKDKEDVPLYKSYPHFAEDSNFEQYLLDIIEEQTDRGEVLLERFKAVDFLQSLAERIDEEQKQIEKEIEKWCKGVAKDYKDFNAFRTLGGKAINESIVKHVESEKARNIIFRVFYTGLVQENLESMNHGMFQTKMKECYDFTCSFILFGGYALVLQHQPKMFDKHFSFIIQQALGLERSLEQLTNEDMYDGARFLKQFLEAEPSVVLDCSFFYGRDIRNAMGRDKVNALGREKMNTALAKMESELHSAVLASQKQDEEKEKVVALAH
ncbi:MULTISPECIES: hypothetical protein [Legionella]|uniref:Substrate of the Dot/Icm secretion system n=1 Tax=Legionella steelei TaxID=947033 RepID=A0A0W0ZEG9_9GAMM|nr:MULTISPECIES: hypothetical protein [Legionella]KTD67449.1 substrate of the Dot/Icm secretion system [Legionella steelei]MBN9227887.1 hypothetical protein [Legionella steelei]OJW16038.1 MAG: hypothetical protein BGO44_06005 [Legionella sp. 39-23]